MRRRDFIIILGGSAAAWPFTAQSQGTPPPIVGFLSQGTPEGTAAFFAAVRRGISEARLVEGRDFTGEFRWANNDEVRLPGLATDLVQRRVAIIVTLSSVTAARAAKAATKEIPIVFAHGTDPVRAGLVTALNRPGGNVTGISSLNLDLGSKWVALLHELLPSAKRLAVLVNIVNGGSARSLITVTQAAALAIGLQLEFVFASDEREIDVALAGLGTRAQALIVHPDALFRQNRNKLVSLALREKLPTISTSPDFGKAGGLMSYGSSFIDVCRQAGVYVGRILRGERPDELPVQQATKFNFTINLKTAKALGLNIPATLLARADSVIE
jgi:putative ABC transport system substrate-binding protein